MREALVSWNHAQDYDCPTYEDYAGRLGGGQFEKVYDLGARPRCCLPHMQRVHTLCDTRDKAASWPAECPRKCSVLLTVPSATCHRAQTV